MDGILELRFVCTRSELAETRRVAMRLLTPAATRWRLRAIYGVLYVLSLFSIERELAKVLELRQRLPIVAGLAVLFVVLASVWQRWTTRVTTAPTHVEVSARDLTVLESGARRTVPWSGFAQAVESPNLFVLIDRAREVCFTLPKRAFPSRETIDWFRARVAGIHGGVPSGSVSSAS